MPLTEDHQQRNEQRLQANRNQRHVTQEEMVEQTLKLLRQEEDQLYQDVLKVGPFPGMTIVQSMIELKRLWRGGALRPDFSFRYYSEDEQGNVLIEGIKADLSKHPETLAHHAPSGESVMTIDEMAAIARDHWMKTNPSVFRKMVKNKDLEKESVAAAELTLMEMKTLMRGGMTEEEAWQASRHLFILSDANSIDRAYNVP